MKVEMTKSDQFGQSHPIETPDLIEFKLKELQERLDKIKKKGAYETAQQKRPDLVAEKYLLWFLRCEVFNAKPAADRLVSYWEKRLELFGPDKAFLPMTLDGAMADSKDALEIGMVCILPEVRDADGRSYLFFDHSKLDPQMDRVKKVQAFWYAVHHALETNPETQKKGIVLLPCPKKIKMTQFDPIFENMAMQSIRGCLPMRVSCIVICHPPSFFNVVWPIVRPFLGSRLRKRVVVAGGGDEKVVKKLGSSVGMRRDQIPELAGGDLHLTTEDWLMTKQ